MFTTTTFIQYSAGSLGQCIKERKSNKAHPSRKGGDQIIPICQFCFIERKLKDFTKRLL